MDAALFAGDFPGATREAWLARVAAVLKGAAFEQTLVARSADGIAIQPLYPKAEAAPPVARATPGRWRVAQRIDHPDPAAANPLALADLEGGADALTLVTRGAPAGRGFGVRIDSLADLDRTLAGVMLDLVHLRLDAGPDGGRLAALVAELAQARGQALSDLSLDLGLDPIGALAATGRMAPWPEVSRRLGATLADLAGRGFAGRAVLADGRVYHEAGAGEAQELAAVLATGLAYLRALEAHGHSLSAARASLAFLLVADADEFLTVAKLRALRRLWARVEQACGLVPQPIRLHAETAWRMTTRRDPWVNLLRATLAAFAAGIGGADAVTVLPFTAALGLPDGFARRMARNTQLILLEEAHLGRVADPAAGAGGFEALTEALCDTAWALFQEIEGDGGLLASLQAGTLQARIAAVRAQRDAAVATRRAPITGTSEFPNLHEAAVGVLLPMAQEPRAQEPRPQDEGGQPQAGEGTITPLPSLRAAEPFERLRDAADAHLARTGARPKVFLATLGPLAAFTARATFAHNAFAAGGCEAVGGEAFASLAALVAAFVRSGAPVACLCGSDETYAAPAEAPTVPGETAAEEAARALAAAGAKRIVLAGRPGERGPALRAAGVDRFLQAGCDLPATLSALRSAWDPEAAAATGQTVP